MKTSTPIAVVTILAAVMLAFAPAALAEEKVKPVTADESATAIEKASNPALLDPSLATEKAPDAFRVKLETTKGDVVILVNRSWAPNGVDDLLGTLDLFHIARTRRPILKPHPEAAASLQGHPGERCIHDAWLAD